MPRQINHLDIFAQCAAAIGGNRLIRRESSKDKEFHFQNWFEARLKELKAHRDQVILDEQEFAPENS